MAIDPVGLVRQYVKRDAAGERLGPNPWFSEVVTWPNEQGYESHTVIRRYKVEPPPTIHGSPAEITVRYDVIGWAMPAGEHSAFVAESVVEVFRFVVVQTEDGWRIQSPQIDQHVLAEVEAAREDVAPEDAARIRELAAQAPAGP